jgi:hypothetical protein
VLRAIYNDILLDRCTIFNVVLVRVKRGEGTPEVVFKAVKELFYRGILSLGRMEMILPYIIGFVKCP